MIELIHEDPRPIKSISLTGPEYGYYKVGHRNVVKIVPYHENGEMASVIWFAIYFDDEKYPRKRINGKYIEEVEYDKPN